MNKLSPKIQEIYDAVKANYKKAEISRGDIYVYDGAVMHIIEEKKTGIKVNSTINMRYGVLLTFLIIFGLLFGFVGVVPVIIVANISTSKIKKAKKTEIIKLIN